VRTIVTTIARKPNPSRRLHATRRHCRQLCLHHARRHRVPDQRQIDVRRMPDDGDLVDLVTDVAPDPTVRDRILVENPERLCFDL